MRRSLAVSGGQPRRCAAWRITGASLLAPRGHAPLAGLLLCCLVADAGAQVTILGGKLDDQARALASDAAGNLYVLGETRSGDIDFRYLLADGQKRGFLAKINRQGKLDWVMLVSDPISHDFGGEVVAFNDNLLISGLDGISAGSWSGGDLSRFDLDGKSRWRHRLLMPPRGLNLLLAVDRGGDLFTTGWYPGSAMAPQSMSLDVVRRGSAVFKGGIMLSKLSKDGGRSWAHVLANDSRVTARGIATAPNGQIVICGEYTGAPTLGGVRLQQAVSGGFAMALDGNGRPVWTTTWVSPSRGLSVSGGVATRPNEIYVSGTYLHGVKLGATNLLSAGASVYVARIDAGQVTWAVSSVGNGLVWPLRLLLQPGERLLLPGTYVGGLRVGRHATPAGAPRGLFVASIDPAGKWLGLHSASIRGGDVELGGAALDRRGALHLAGSFAPGARLGCTLLRSNGARDVFIWHVQRRQRGRGRQAVRR